MEPKIYLRLDSMPLYPLELEYGDGVEIVRFGQFEKTSSLTQWLYSEFDIAEPSDSEIRDMVAQHIAHDDRAREDYRDHYSPQAYANIADYRRDYLDDCISDAARHGDDFFDAFMARYVSQRFQWVPMFDRPRGDGCFPGALCETADSADGIAVCPVGAFAPESTEKILADSVRHWSAWATGDVWVLCVDYVDRCEHCNTDITTDHDSIGGLMFLGPDDENIDYLFDAVRGRFGRGIPRDMVEDAYHNRGGAA